jgi:ParB family chromosome partitioning protein
LEERKQEEQTSHNEEEKEVSDTQDIQEKPAHSVDHSVQIRTLRKQDERNREIVIEHTLDDAKQLIRNLPQYSGKLSDLEIRMMYFFMLSSVSRDNERILIPDRDFATTHDKLKLVDKLTDENMNLIVREYLRVNFHQQVYRGSAFADRFLAFVHQHCPESLAEVSQKYNDIYEKRKKRIEDQIAELTPPTSDPTEQAAPDVPEPFLFIEETEPEFSEALSDVSANDDQMLEVA